MPGAGPARGGGDGEPGMSAHGQRHLPVPNGVLLDLALVQGGLVLVHPATFDHDQIAHNQ